MGKLSHAFNNMTVRIKKMLHLKEQLLLNISHELRSPLTRSNVALKFLPDGKAKNSINDDILEMEYMITELLESARLSKEHCQINTKKTDFIRFFNNIMDKFNKYYPNIQFMNPCETFELEFDSDKIETVINNIIFNSVKYSENKDDLIEIKLFKKEDHMVLEINNHGKGIDEENLLFIFEPFYRADKSRTRKIGGY